MDSLELAIIIVMGIIVVAAAIYGSSDVRVRGRRYKDRQGSQVTAPRSRNAG